MIREYKHENGYKAIFYGESSMVIQKENEKPIIHTFSRNVNTEEEVMELLAIAPMFIERL